MKELYKLSVREKNDLSEKIILTLKNREEICFAYLFGSFINKEVVSFRDIDIGIFLRPEIIPQEKGFDYENKLAAELAKLLSFPADRLDIKILNFTSINFQNAVYSRGKLLFTRDNEFFANIIESVSLEAMCNYDFVQRSLRELVNIKP